MFKRYSFPEDDCHGRILIMRFAYDIIQKDVQPTLI